MAYDNSIEESYYDAALDEWSDDLSAELYKSVEDLLCKKCRDEFIIKMGMSLADNFIRTGNCHFFESYGLNESNAYCFLNEQTGDYVKEVKSCFDEYRNS